MAYCLDLPPFDAPLERFAFHKSAREFAVAEACKHIWSAVDPRDIVRLAKVIEANGSPVEIRGARVIREGIERNIKREVV